MVFTPVAEWMRQGTVTWSGTFLVAGAAITAGNTKFKNAVTITYNGTGLYTFAMFADNPKLVPYKPKRLSDINPTFLTPTGVGDGGWGWSLNADNVATLGTFQIKVLAQAFAAADPSQLVRITWMTEQEVA